MISGSEIPGFVQFHNLKIPRPLPTASRMLIRVFRSTFFTHRLFIPEVDEVSIGISKLGAIAPHELLRRLVERDAPRCKLTMFRVNVADLKRKGARRSHLIS